jgi:hypothetical protein
MTERSGIDEMSRKDAVIGSLSELNNAISFFFGVSGTALDFELFINSTFALWRFWLQSLAFVVDMPHSMLLFLFSLCPTL